MGKVWVIAKREVRSYFNGAMAYIFINVFLLLTGWLFFKDYFLVGSVDMRGFFGFLPWVFLFLIPAVTMRLWAEEKKQGTAEVLLTLPLRDYQIVLGKFLGCWFFVLVSLLCTFAIPVLVSFTGDLEWGVVFSSYLGAAFMAGAYIAIGLYISFFTDNQIIAFIFSVVVLFAMLVIGQNFVVYSLPSFLQSFVQFLGLGGHFESMMRGVIDSRDVFYYFSIIGLFIYLNLKQLEGRQLK